MRQKVALRPVQKFHLHALRRDGTDASFAEAPRT
jgi:hypothetical protein